MVHLVPSVKAIDGLLEGTDSVAFHSDAVKMAAAIEKEGWSAWELRPKSGGTPISVTAIFYRYFGPHPWVLLPLNAIVQALAALCLVLILQSLVSESRRAILGGILFVLYPSALMWYGQIHRDGFYILGYFLILCSWLHLTQMEAWSDQIYRKIGLSLAELILGASLVWFSRPHVQSVIFALSLPIAALLLGKYVYRRRIFLAAVVVSAILILRAFVPVLQNSDHEFTNEEVARRGLSPAAYAEHWRSSVILPRAVDFRLKELALRRNAFRMYYVENASYIDNAVRFDSAFEVLEYLPRAFQIGFLSPFPNMWFSRGSTSTGSMFRFFSSLEMLGVYLALLSLLLRLPHLIFKVRFWVLAWLGTGLIVSVALVVNNLGTLYRLRYGHLMPFVALGFALAVPSEETIGIWKRKFSRKRSAIFARKTIRA